MRLLPRFDDLGCHRDPGVPEICRLTLRRRDGKANALTASMAREAASAFRWVTDRQNEACVVVLTSALDRHFCAGLDLAGVRDEASGNPGVFDAASDLLLAVAECPAYLICAARGGAIGAGGALGMACDYFVVDGESDARVHHPEQQFGLLPWLSIPYILRRMLRGPGGYEAARSYLNSRAPWGPDDCLRAGLVDEVWRPGRGPATFGERVSEVAWQALERIRLGGRVKAAYPAPPPPDGSTDPGGMVGMAVRHLRGESGVSDRDLARDSVGRLRDMARRPETRALIDAYAAKIGRRSG